MNVLTIGTNIKKLRDERKITQQQLADAVGISFQAVSKWENGTTVPDVGLLPEIAGFFDVTIDELFRPNMTAYRNKASRHMAIYESDWDNSEAFEKADAEYKKLFAGNDFDAVDIGYYAYLNECRARHYQKIAEKYYLDAIEQGSKLKDEAYYKNQRQFILFLSRLGRSSESIERYTKILENEPDNPMNYSSLVSAYACANDPNNAFNIAERGLAVFPDDAILLVYAGDICKRLGKFDKAIEYWDRAFKIDNDMIDARYSMACYLSEKGCYIEAEKVFEEIFKWNESRGFDIENGWIRDELAKLGQKKKQS